MGNVLRSLYGHCCKPTTTDDHSQTQSQGPHGVSAANIGVSALAQDLFHFQITSQVPEGLSKHVISSRKAQAKWYGKLVEAWKDAKPPPKTAEEAARLVVQTLSQHQKPDVEGFLAFYGLPLPETVVELTAGFPTSLPEGVQFEMQSLPVDAKAVADGDSLTLYVSVADPRESLCIPPEVNIAAVKRSKAREKKKYAKADELHNRIIDAGYRVLNIRNQEILARKYRIRLRGIDAPEGEMPYGKEAREELVKLIEGKCLRILVYCEDRYGRTVGDVYCNGIFVQEMMLKKGCAWHYIAYDKRVELAKWQKEAQAKRIGLWALRNPEEPWEWRKKERQSRL